MWGLFICKVRCQVRGYLHLLCGPRRYPRHGFPISQPSGKAGCKTPKQQAAHDSALTRFHIGGARPRFGVGSANGHHRCASSVALAAASGALNGNPPGFAVADAAGRRIAAEKASGLGGSRLWSSKHSLFGRDELMILNHAWQQELSRIASMSPSSFPLQQVAPHL